MSLDKELLNQILQNIIEFSNSPDRKQFAIETSKVSKDLGAQILDSLRISEEKLKIRITI